MDIVVYYMNNCHMIQPVHNISIYTLLKLQITKKSCSPYFKPNKRGSARIM